MDKNEIKRANRKALPQFMLIMVICFIIGGTIGFCSAKYGLNTLAGGMKTAGMFFGTYIAPWLMLAAAVIVPVVCVPIYQSATKLLASWDGENEEMSDTIDEKLSIVLWVTSAAFILSYFLIAASYANGFETFKTETSGALFLAGIIGFLTIMIEAVIFQQKCVDTTKKMNPEKTASVYDTKFQKKWMESCDEAEKIMIGKCAFKAYAATNTVCSILSIVLAICALVFGIGFLPSLVVCLIWIVNQAHSKQSHQEMLDHVEGLLQKLELPYRILRLCGGDMSFTAALCFDFEVYSEAQKRWLEVSSVSNFDTYQANRLKCRYRNAEKKTELCHTLNGSALALPRIVAALLENNQTPEGIRIPKALVPYCGFDMID